MTLEHTENLQVLETLKFEQIMGKICVAFIA
jgi:hypothetical protein